jgi:PAS domain S-box-containing protein
MTGVAADGQDARRGVADSGASAASTLPLDERDRSILASAAAATLRIAGGSTDRASLWAALIGGLAYLALACVSLLFAQAGDIVSPIWLPNACAVAVLLRARLRGELPFLLACAIANVVAYAVVRLPDATALLFTAANIAEIIVVLALIRAGPRPKPDMNQIGDLARLAWAGGLIAPLASAAMTVPAMADNWVAVPAGGLTWFLTNSMAMILIVPAMLLMIDRVTGQLSPAPAQGPETAALLCGGMACTLLVFDQPLYPLLFLIQPITLLHAFRLGSLGSALHVAGVAVVAGGMTWLGRGPIATASGSAIADLHLLQAFIAANVLTGLPVAAIMAGRDRMLARLEAGKREVDLLADNISDAILRFDMAGVCTYASPSVCEVMGAPPSAYLGAHAAARLHPDARDLAMQALDRLLDGTSEHERITYRRYADSADGLPVFLEADCSVVHDPLTGSREGVVMVARDVTKRVELELLLTRARRHAENAARAKSEFLANMSHEIRTPMNGVLGFAELMLQGELAADQRRFAEMIVRSGRSMMVLLNDVLDLSKIESGQFAIDRAPVNLHASLAECAALHRPSAERKGLTLELADDGSDQGEAGAPWVLTDGLRLRQIMLNLIGNAVKFTEAGHIRITYAITGHDVRVTVADTGIGISPLQIEAIFKPFTQADADTARRFGGTGLGLSISRQLAALLGGRIEVESTPGAGSRFALVLPAALAPPIAEESGPEPQPGTDLFTPLPGASGILLVEDNDINRELIREMLERCGQQVEVAHDGNEGIAMVIDSIMRGRPYDLVLMDVQMPDCDGLAATRAIRAEGIGPGLLPIVALTANAFPEDIAAARAAGMQAHLAKPVVFAQLARALQRWLPTRIVEADRSGAAEAGVRLTPAARATQLARSPQLVARWLARRTDALAAVETALAAQWLARPAPLPQSEAEALGRVLHKLAGTAGMFGEPALGEAAGIFERALVAGAAGGDALLAHAQALLAIAADHEAGPTARTGSASR